MATNRVSEQLKHQLALEIEEKKWSYRKQELQFLEAGQHLRALNQIMWQVPGMAIAITGGIWYGATLVTSDLARQAALGFVGLADLLTIPIIYRLRSLIGDEIDRQKSFASTGIVESRNTNSSTDQCVWRLAKLSIVKCWEGFSARVLCKDTSPKRERTVVRYWALVLLSASILSFLGMLNPSQLGTVKKEEKVTQCCNVQIENVLPPIQCSSQVKESRRSSAIEKPIGTSKPPCM